MVGKILWLTGWMVAVSPLTVFGQLVDSAPALLHFQDSVRRILKSTRATDSTMATQFDEMWPRLTLEQKKTLRRQSSKIWQEQYLPKTDFSHYYGAVVYAYKNNTALLDNYFTVAEQVIDRRNQSVATNFFGIAYQLFRQESLHMDKGVQLHLQEAAYTFDYVEDDIPVPVEGDENESQESLYDDYDDWEDTPLEENDTIEEQEADRQIGELDDPLWMSTSPEPEMKGPVLRFDRVTFHFVTPYDSVFLKNTTGVLSFANNTFMGEGGSFDWSSVGLSSDSVYFTFKKYNFNITKPTIKSTLGKLTYVGRLPQATAGVFEFDSKKHNTPDQARYPRFTSLHSNIAWTNMQSDSLSYIGGFALEGKVAHSRSINQEDATLEILGRNNVKIIAQAPAFEWGDSTISSQDAKVTIQQGVNAIYHPSVLVWYEMGLHKLTLTKNGTQQAAYFSPYFNVGFTADKLQWDMRSDSLLLTADGGRGQNPMILESVNFYDLEEFRILTGYGFTFHPVVLVVHYALKKHIREFYVTELAQGTGQQFQDVHRAMLFLARKGVLEYDASTGFVRLTEKIINIFNARKGDADYDNLKIHSVTDGMPNAILSLQDKQMKIQGVEALNVSDSLNVIITPNDNLIALSKNRSIQFDGKITAGNFEIDGADCVFRYDSFLIYLNHINSIQLYVVENNERGQKIRRKIDNMIEGVDSTHAPIDASHKGSATIYISKPNNKSGKKKEPDYPRLDVATGGIIYFDRKTILNGSYDRSVFYELPPFKVDSLNDADPATIRFDGKFVSGGIFPPFQQEIYTRPDKSLGFLHTIPDEGYALFGKEGKAVGSIDLSNAGIRLSGEISHLNAQIKSNDFICYPDSVVGLGTRAELREQQVGNIQYPDIYVPSFRLKWIPARDWFELNSVGVPFSLYKSSAQLTGSVLLSKKGTFGKGKLFTRGFDATSEDFSFQVDGFEARHADFNLSTAISDKPAIAGKDIRLRFSLEKNYADISPETVGDAALEFPYAQFKTSIPEARWDLNTQKVMMEKTPDMSLQESYFYTTRPDLDSLNFMGEEAEYDVNKQTLQVRGIPYIKVADAKVIPNNHEILILENAHIGTLEKAQVILDTLNEYHHLIDGTITIFSRNKFSGRATYQHVNANNDTFAIKMTDFRTESLNRDRKNISKGKRKQSLALTETVASGVVNEEDRFVLFSNIFYKGNITMYATRPSLQLEGSIKLNLKKIKNYDTWIKYEQSGDEKNIFLNFNEAETEHGKRPSAGLHFAGDNSLYATFTFDKKDPRDDDFFLPEGSLFYSKESGEFHIENRLRASGDQFSGTSFTYNENQQEVKFAGPVYFFGKNVVQKNFSLEAAALGSTNLVTHEMQMNTLLIVDPHIPPQALSVMADDLQTVVDEEALEEGLGDQTKLLYKIADIVGENAVTKFERQSAKTYTSLTTIPRLLKPLLFANIDMKRSIQHKAFYNTGMLGLSNILNREINGNFEGFIEIKMTEDGGAVFNLFFRASPSSWYYFSLEDNRLLVHSSNDQFNTIISKKANTGTAKMGSVSFAQGSTEEMLDFVNRFRKEYYDLEDPFQLDSPLPQSPQEEESKEDGF